MGGVPSKIQPQTQTANREANTTDVTHAADVTDNRLEGLVIISAIRISDVRNTGQAVQAQSGSRVQS